MQEIEFKNTLAENKEKAGYDQRVLTVIYFFYISVSNRLCISTINLYFSFVSLHLILFLLHFLGNMLV